MNREAPRSGYENNFNDNGYNGSVDGRLYGYPNGATTQFNHMYVYGQDVTPTPSTMAVPRAYYVDQNEMYIHEGQQGDYTTNSGSSPNEQFQQESYAYQPERYPSHLRHTGTRASRTSFTYPALTEAAIEALAASSQYVASSSTRHDGQYRTNNNRSNTRPRQQRRKVLRFRDQMIEEFTTETYFQTPSRPAMYPSGASFRLYHPEELPCPVLDQLPRSDAVTKHLRNCMLISGELGVTTRWTLMPSTKFTVCELYPNEMLICREKTKNKVHEPVALTGIMVEILSPVSMSLRVAHTQKEMVRLSVREGQEMLLQEWYWMLHVAMAMKVDVADASGGGIGASAAKKKESKTRSVWVVRSIDEDNEPSYSNKAARYISTALAGAEVQVLHNGDVGSRLLAERINEYVHGRTLRESVFLGRHVLGEDQIASRAMRRKLAYDLFVQRGRIKRLVLVVEEELLAAMVARAQPPTDQDELGNGFTTSMLDMCNGVEFAVDMKTGDTKIVAAFG
ncbi:hypothetical protein DYB37_000550 [Aphanomyces astaci]|uniref:Uncharacterized protein n=2 Tax=Aphanomyces astaci TaxID=112090 RepID=A0A397E8Q9_APHAT|nr:hypothetical protein DYB25_000255 [Aphanomyces astaci]RHY07670.1 hypothetical protein DYB36_000857 [Aphanomyces astaci]RHY61689.1 hypothetical protein DYB30_000492 [Aphanomyces astaci]RHY74306.1 hypothetical protein DYB38_000015 [Aphanomyces astaci]RHY74372.1 hypothetical protein DYB34_000092 [Aphanomyces astaci]